MIFSDAFRAIGQMGDPRFQSVLWRGIGLTVLLLVAIYAVFVWLIGWFVPDSFTLPWIGEITWVDNLLSGGSLVLMLGLSVFLMVPVASAFTGLFLEEVAEAVEDRHYPAIPPAPRTPFGTALADGLGFFGVLVVANVLALALYLIFVPFAPFIFWGLNGFLLGREYFQMVALRREGRDGARALRRRHTLTIWAAGCLMALPLTVPIVNLLVPVLGAATFTHLYHRVVRAQT